jgi:phospholipid transport system substrate-binding protein
MRWGKIIVFLLLALGLGAGPVLGATPTEVVRGILTEVLQIQNNPALNGSQHEAERARAIRQVIQRSFDFPYMAENSLGPSFHSLSSAQRQEFIQVFSSLFQASYTNLVLQFLKKETVKYGPETKEGQGVRVATTLIRTNDSIPVDYLLHQRNGKWLLYDVVVDGVSILEKYQNGFAQEVRSRSFDSLLSKMKTQLKALP